MTAPALYGLFGGTFNPIHNGHLCTVRSVNQQVGFAGISVIPAAIPPHKTAPTVSAQHRLQMVRLALADEPHFQVDDFEIRQHQTSYSLHTIRYFRQQLPQHRLCLILGMDALIGFTSWYQWQQILSLCHLVVMHRPGFPTPMVEVPWWQQVQSAHALRQYPAGRILVVDNEQVNISSTEIREKVKMHQAIDPYVPKAVLNYIQQNHLYQYDN